MTNAKENTDWTDMEKELPKLVDFCEYKGVPLNASAVLGHIADEKPDAVFVIALQKDGAISFHESNLDAFNVIEAMERYKHAKFSRESGGWE